MTKQQPNEQNTRRYKYHTSSAVMSPVVRRRASQQREEVQYVMPKASGRRVTTPQAAVQPPSWAERHARVSHAQSKQLTQGRLVPRTFAQTGAPAPIGQRRTNKPLPRRRSRMAVPVRRRGGFSRFWRRLFGLLIIVAALGAGLNFALNNATFHVQQVRIAGTHDADLISAIQHMGMQGQDIFLLNQTAVLKQLDAWPLVRSARLDIQLPNTVTVTVQERVPVVLWQSGRTTYALAQDGTVLAPLSALSDSQGLPTVVDNRQGVHMRPGARLDAAQIAFAQQLAQQLPNVQGVAPFRLQYVNRITVNGQTVPANQAGAGSYVVVSAHGWQAYMGDAVNAISLKDRVLELQEVLHIAQQEHVQLATIDVRFGWRPTYTVQV